MSACIYSSVVYNWLHEYHNELCHFLSGCIKRTFPFSATRMHIFIRYLFRGGSAECWFCSVLPHFCALIKHNFTPASQAETSRSHLSALLEWALIRFASCSRVRWKSFFNRYHFLKIASVEEVMNLFEFGSFLFSVTGVHLLNPSVEHHTRGLDLSQHALDKHSHSHIWAIHGLFQLTCIPFNRRRKPEQLERIPLGQTLTLLTMSVNWNPTQEIRDLNDLFCPTNCLKQTKRLVWNIRKTEKKWTFSHLRHEIILSHL